jgi:hypothetical protein
MNEKDIKKLSDLAKRKLKEKRTKVQARPSLVSAGIMTKVGNYTKPYKNLSRLVKHAGQLS